MWTKCLEYICCFRNRHKYNKKEEEEPLRDESVSKKIKRKFAPTRGDSVWGNLGEPIPEVNDDGQWEKWAKDDFDKGYSSYGLY